MASPPSAARGRRRDRGGVGTTNAGRTPNADERRETPKEVVGREAALVIQREASKQEDRGRATTHSGDACSDRSGYDRRHLELKCDSAADEQGDGRGTCVDHTGGLTASRRLCDYGDYGNVCVGKGNVKLTEVENVHGTTKRVNDRWDTGKGGWLDVRDTAPETSSPGGPCERNSVLDTSDWSDYGSICTGSPASVRTVTASIGSLPRTSTCDEDDDVFVTGARSDRRTGSPVSDCAEDSGIEAEEGDMRARLIRNVGKTHTGAFQPVDIGNGITVHKAGNGMLLKSVQDGEQPGPDGIHPPRPLEANNHGNHDATEDDTAVTMGETIYKTVSVSEKDGSSSSTNNQHVQQEGTDPMTPQKRPPHIIPPEVRRIMRVTSQSAPSSPLGRRRVHSEYIPRSPCMSPFRAPPPSFPAPPSPGVSRLMVGQVPPPGERRRPRRNRLSWDPSRPDFAFDIDSPMSSRSITPNPEYLEADMRFNFRGHGVGGTSPEGSLKGNGSSGSDTSGEIATALRNTPKLTLDISAASCASVSSSVAGSPRCRRRVVSCSSPRPHLAAPPSPGFSLSPHHRQRTRSRTSQALVPHKPVMRSRSADRAQHLPLDHRLQSRPNNPDEVLQKASKLQLDLLKSKKVIEKTLTERLQEDMEKQDELSSAIKRSMKEPRTKDQVKAANRKVKKVIQSDVVEDPDTLTKYYKVEVDLGNYTNNVSSKVVVQTVKITGTTPDVPRYTKELSIEFPDTVNMQRIDVLQIGHKMILGVPFKSSARRKPSLTDVLEPEGDPNDPMQRISFLEGLFRSLKLPWPPEGATAHYEYLTGRCMGDEDIASKDVNYDRLFADDVKRSFHKDSNEDVKQSFHKDSNEDVKQSFHKDSNYEEQHLTGISSVNKPPSNVDLQGNTSQDQSKERNNGQIPEILLNDNKTPERSDDRHDGSELNNNNKHQANTAPMTQKTAKCN